MAASPLSLSPRCGGALLGFFACLSHGESQRPRRLRSAAQQICLFFCCIGAPSIYQKTANKQKQQKSFKLLRLAISAIAIALHAATHADVNSKLKSRLRSSCVEVVEKEDFMSRSLYAHAFVAKTAERCARLRAKKRRNARPERGEKQEANGDDARD